MHAGDAETAYALIHNNLGVISAQMEPQIQTVLDWLRKQDGTVAVDVCGSGACSFAICDTAATGRKACRRCPAKRLVVLRDGAHSQHGSHRSAKESKKFSLAHDGNLCYYSRANGLWLSLVERCVRDAEVVGSNPVASTTHKEV